MANRKKHALLICSTNSVGRNLLDLFEKHGWMVSQTNKKTETSTVAESKTYFLDIASDESISAFSQAIGIGAKIDATIFLCGYLGGQSLLPH